MPAGRSARSDEAVLPLEGSGAAVEQGVKVGGSGGSHVLGCGLPHPRQLLDDKTDEGGLIGLAAVRDGGEIGGVGFDQQPLFGHPGGHSTQVCGIAKGQNARERDVKTQIQPPLGALPVAGVAVQYAADFGGPQAIEQIESFAEGIAGVDDQRLFQFPGRFDVVFQPQFLQLARRRPVRAEKIEAGFADGDHLLIGTQGDQMIDARLPLPLIDRVQADARQQFGVGPGEVNQARRLLGRHRNAEGPIDAGMAHVGQGGVEVGRQLRKVKMAVRIGDALHGVGLDLSLFEGVEPGRASIIESGATTAFAAGNRGAARQSRPRSPHFCRRSVIMIDLYYWMTPNGHKVTMALEELGLEYRIHPINIGRGDQFDSSFLAIAPNNRIPAIVDQAPADGVKPVPMFESGSILLYLAEKTGKLLPRDSRARWTAVQWLMWQMGGLGPMLGQNHHFGRYAPEPIPYAIERYRNETLRLYRVLNRQLENSGGDYIAGEYSIADIACYPWILPWEGQGMQLGDHPTLSAWFERIRQRPAVVRAYGRAEEFDREDLTDDKVRQVLFGQTDARNPALAD